MISFSKRFVTITGIVIAIVAVCLAGVAWAVVTHHDEPVGGTDAGFVFADPLTADPELAATSAMMALTTWEPAHQESPQDSAAGIANRLTGTLGKYAAAGEPDPVLPKPWASWAKNNTVVEGIAVADEGGLHLGNDGMSADVDMVVTQTVHHKDGRTTPYSRFSVRVSVVKEEGLWKASKYDTTGVDY